MQIKTANWPSADEIEACNSDLIVAIIEVIAENTIPTENYLILLGDLFKLNPKQTITKNYEKRDMGPLSFLPLADAPKRKKERGPMWRRGDGEALGARARRRFSVDPRRQLRAQT